MGKYKTIDTISIRCICATHAFSSHLNFHLRDQEESHTNRTSKTTSKVHSPQSPKSLTHLEAGDKAPAPIHVAILHVHHATRVEKRQRIQRLHNHRANAGLERANRGLAGKIGQ